MRKCDEKDVLKLHFVNISTDLLDAVLNNNPHMLNCLVLLTISLYIFARFDLNM